MPRKRATQSNLGLTNVGNLTLEKCTSNTVLKCCIELVPLYTTANFQTASTRHSKNRKQRTCFNSGTIKLYRCPRATDGVRT
ncbi:unnamed protein product [Dicrocoelium dendriticum]|nr:unnamed protein product [Dicrocoelium dendriticum]